MKIGSQSLSQQFSLSVRKYTEETINKFQNMIWQIVSDSAESWEEQVKKALGIQLPYDMVGKKTRPQNRPFPYMRSGELQRSVQARFSRRKGREGTYTFAISGEIGATQKGSLHARLTNLAANSTDVGWEGWRDDLLFGNGRAGIPSLKSIFDSIKQNRKSK